MTKATTMRRFTLLLAVLAVSGLFAPSVVLGGSVRKDGAAAVACSSSYVDGVIAGAHKCLRAGEWCSPQYEADYEHYGFSCVGGRLRRGGSAPATPTTTTSAETPRLGRTVRLGALSKTHGCQTGVLPDRRCSPGAYYSGLTTAVICSPTFHTRSIRNVPESEKHAVERSYGIAARPYGRTLEIDHIVSLELGGSNDIANIFPERAPGYHAKDRLENRLHAMVCAGEISLGDAARGIASNWVALYRRVFQTTPTL